MARGQRQQAPQNASSADGVEASAEERKGKRGHDKDGNVRPADGRYELHDPKDESKYVRTPRARRKQSEETS